MARHYYNEFAPKPAAWLRQLMADGLIPKGEVDERSITEVQPADLVGYVQCHFFAGIGGWPLALRLAGWPEDRPVWTGSCPCQPWSGAGKLQKRDDPRHLWPDFYRLTQKHRPPDMFGEQVAKADGLDWLDDVFADLEASDYACGAANIPACSVGLDQERQRIWWYATTNAAGFNGQAHDCVVPSGAGRASKPVGRLSGMHVAGRWWTAGDRVERMPTLVRNFDGLSAILAGFGNAIVPEVAAEFILACCECSLTP